MRRHQPHRAERRLGDRLDQHARHVACRCRLPGQEMAERLRDAVAGQDQVAEALAPAATVIDIDADALDGGKARQHLREEGELVGGVIAVEIGKIRRHLLQAEHVEIRHRARVIDDAPRIDAIVGAARPLDVPGDQLHRNLARVT